MLATQERSLVEEPPKRRCAAHTQLTQLTVHAHERQMPESRPLTRE